MPVDKDKILAIARERFEEASEADQPERVEADEDVRFAINDGGCQWDANVKSMRENAHPPRPCLVVNLIPEKIDQAEGEFRQAEISYKVRPVDSVGDPRTANILAGMLRAIEYDSKARNAYNSSFNSTLYSGRGAWRWDVVEDEDNPWVRSLKISRISNVFTLYWDPFAKELDKSDARYWFETEMVPKEEFNEKYGDENWDDWEKSEEWESWFADNSRRVANYWWVEQENVTYYKVNRLGEEKIVTELDEFDEIIEEKTVKRPKIKWCKLTAGSILEGPHTDWPSRYFPFIVQVGKEVTVRGKNRSRGKVRFAKEPQELYNYAVSQLTELLSLAPKARFLISARMIGAYKDIWDNANIENNIFLPYESDPANPGAKPDFIPPVPIDSSNFNVLAVMEHNIMSTMGRNQASLGDKGDEKSGKAIFARQAQGVSGDTTYTTNFEAALLHSCRVGIDLIPHVYDTERIARIIGEDQAELDIPINAGHEMMGQMAGQVPEQYMVQQENGLLNDLGVGRYDARVTVGPSYNTQREESLAMLVELAGRAPQYIQALIVGIVENMDLPKSDQILKRLKAAIPQEFGGDMQPQPQQTDPKLVIEMQKLMIDQNEQQRKWFDSYFKSIGVVAQAESLEAGQQIDQYMGIVDRHQKQIELEQQQQQLEQQQAQQQQTPQGATE